jgi:hypothetical protein
MRDARGSGPGPVQQSLLGRAQGRALARTGPRAVVRSRTAPCPPRGVARAGPHRTTEAAAWPSSDTLSAMGREPQCQAAAAAPATDERRSHTPVGTGSMATVTYLHRFPPAVEDHANFPPRPGHQPRACAQVVVRVCPSASPSCDSSASSAGSNARRSCPLLRRRESSLRTPRPQGYALRPPRRLWHCWRTTASFAERSRWWRVVSETPRGHAVTTALAAKPLTPFTII